MDIVLQKHPNLPGLIYRILGIILIAIVLGFPPLNQAEDEFSDLQTMTSIVIEVDNGDLAQLMTVLSDNSAIECAISRNQAEADLNKLKSRIGEAAKAYGYYQLNFEHSLTRTDACWQPLINVEAGAQTRVTAVDIEIIGEAGSDIDFAKQYESKLIKVGDGLRHQAYENLKKSILSSSRSRGYFDASYVLSELRVDQQTGTAVIILKMDSGVRYRIGDITVQQDALHERLFSEYIGFESGDYFSDNSLLSTYQIISQSGYFASIEVAPRINQRRNGEVPVVVAATKGKSISYSAGVGAATDTGPRVNFYYRNRLANEYGHSHRTQLSLSPVISTLNFSYRIPDQKATTDYYEISAQATDEDTETAKSTTWNLGVARTNLLENDWLRTYGLTYSIDDFDVGVVEGRTALLRPILGFSKIKVDSPLHIKRGYRLNAEFSAASEAVVSDIDMAQTKLGGKFVYGLGSDFRLLSRLDIGFTAVDEFDRFPTSLRFFAGGDSSIRGYKYESLGPENENGEVVGGENLLVGSIEIDYPIKPNWLIAGFIDAGNAYTGSNFDARGGAGIGLRWLSPVGPVRIDLAFPVDDDDVDQDFRIHISLGPDL